MGCLAAPRRISLLVVSTLTIVCSFPFTSLILSIANTMMHSLYNKLHVSSNIPQPRHSPSTHNTAINLSPRRDAHKWNALNDWGCVKHIGLNPIYPKIGNDVNANFALNIYMGSMPAMTTITSPRDFSWFGHAIIFKSTMTGQWT